MIRQAAFSEFYGRIEEPAFGNPKVGLRESKPQRFNSEEDAQSACFF